MKPNFALTLSFEGIGLLHRAYPGWNMVREIGFDGADLTADLADLRAAAEAVDPGPIRTKLVIPNDQIRYLSFDAAGLEGDEIASAVRRALDGATPYAVDDLVYDWSISAGEVTVAAVARETLSEAESFAAQHAFNPLCFVAIPEDRAFLGEPWFGETSMAAELLDGAARVIRDTTAIRVIGTATPVKAQDTVADTPVDPPVPQQDTDADTKTQTNDAPVDLVGTDPSEPDPSEPDTSEPDTSEPDTSEPDTSEPDAPQSKPSEPDAVAPPAPEDAPKPAEDTSAKADDAPTQLPAPDKTPTPEPSPAVEPVTFSTIRASRDTPAPKAPPLAGAARDTDAPAAPKAPSRAEPPITAKAPPAPQQPAQVTGTPENAAPQDAAARIGATLRPTEADRLTTPVVSIDAPDISDTKPLDDLGDIPPPPAFMAENTPSTQPDPTPDPTPDTVPASGPVSSPEPAPTRAGLSFFTRRARDAARRTPKTKTKSRATPPGPTTDREREKQRMTVFGARKAAPVGGKPRFLGVILTAVLLIFLVGVAAWASIFMEDGLARLLRDSPPDAASQTVAATPDAPETALPAEDPIDEAGIDTRTGETVLAALPGATDLDTPPREARPPPAPAVLSETEARTRYAVTGIWQRAPDAPTAPGAGSTDDFYLTSIDPKVIEQDAVALPNAAALLQDTRPDTPADPASPGTTFRLDPRGFVQATPGGALTPEGVLVYAGQPALTPPDRPAETLGPSAEETETAAAQTAETTRLGTIRPRTRPDTLSETNERENLGGRTNAELASIRPRLRPPSAQELAQQAAAASTADVTPDADAVQDALAEAQSTPDPFAGATKQAVRVSVKPNPRPRNFDRIVRRAQEETKQENVQTAAIAVPRNQRVKPSGPTPTSVARAATEKNALRLKRVNLIGVYGSTSNRRALVRLANGRYKKVKVGDRLDGGRVAAIGTSELRYVKSGRSVTLKMPKG